MKVETAAGIDYAYVGMNLQDPALRHREVRKAIGYAIDRDAIFQPDIRGVSLSAVADYAFLRHVYREPGAAAAR
jgi:ABC-type oligopeptide transport system substrate-binding subunit